MACPAGMSLQQVPMPVVLSGWGTLTEPRNMCTRRRCTCPCACSGGQHLTMWGWSSSLSRETSRMMPPDTPSSPWSSRRSFLRVTVSPVSRSRACVRHRLSAACGLPGLSGSRRASTLQLHPEAAESCTVQAMLRWPTSGPASGLTPRPGAARGWAAPCRPLQRLRGPCAAGRQRGRCAGGRRWPWRRRAWRRRRPSSQSTGPPPPASAGRGTP